MCFFCSSVLLYRHPVGPHPPTFFSLPKSSRHQCAACITTVLSAKGHLKYLFIFLVMRRLVPLSCLPLPIVRDSPLSSVSPGVSVGGRCLSTEFLQAEVTQRTIRMLSCEELVTASCWQGPKKTNQYKEVKRTGNYKDFFVVVVVVNMD